MKTNCINVKHFYKWQWSRSWHNNIGIPMFTVTITRVSILFCKLNASQMISTPPDLLCILQIYNIAEAYNATSHGQLVLNKQDIRNK